MGERPPPSPDLDQFEEAVNALRRRVPITEDKWRELDQVERQHAFTVAGVAEARVVQEVHEALDRAVADGTTLDDFKAQVGAELAAAWGGPDAPRTEAVFRTNVLQAYNEGRQEIFSHPEVRRARPFLRFDAIDDSRLDDCEICKPLLGTILPADDPFWAKHQPPLHPNCRCIHTPLAPDEAEDEGIAEAPPEAEPPAEGFGRALVMEVDYSAFSPEIARALREKLED